MSATIATAPPARAYTRQSIWVELESSEITPVYAYFEITITDGGPTVGQTLTLTWPGGSITYTVAASISQTGTNWPTQGGGESLEAYTNRIAEFLRHREDVAEIFEVTVEDGPGGIIRLTHPVAEAFDLTVTTDTMTNVAATASDGSAYTLAENLRAYLEVWTDTGEFNTEERLMAFHSPYDIPTAATQIDISAAFAHLSPHLPDEATINPSSPSSLAYGEATSHFQAYFLRYADKYGAPAIAEALLRSDDSYLAVLGARASDAEINTLTGLRHSYRRRDEGPGIAFRKPVGVWQPDWVYFLFSTGADVYVNINILWSDGTETSYNPFGTTTVNIPAGNLIYWFPSGYRQMKLNTQTPSGGTDPDAYIVGYDWKIKTDGGSTLVTVGYDVLLDSSWEQYLLFSNGVGGMETVWLRGKTSEGFAVEGEEFQRPRRPDHTVLRGDFGAFAQAGRAQWALSTGWYSEPFYIEHLRQVLLSEAWLVDRVNRRFLKAIVEPQTIEEWRRDDETLFSLAINVKAGWTDPAVNI